MQRLRAARLRVPFLALLLVLGATLGASVSIVLLLRSPPAEANDELRVTHEPAEGADNLVVALLPARPGVLVHYRIEDPREPIGTPGRVLLAWNATEGEPHHVPLAGLPRLLFITARPDMSGAPLHHVWLWHGHGHVLVAKNPQDLARQLSEATS